MSKPYDSSWDDLGNRAASERKFEEWLERDWPAWLEQKLSFPFEVERVEDDDEAYFTDVAEREPFRAGHTFVLLGIEMEDEVYGVIVKAREGRRVGYVPLCDVEVTSREDPNFWWVREYVVWYANRD